MKQKTCELSFVDFSTEIIVTGDIDPDYIFLRNHLSKFGRSETVELFKKKLLIYNLEYELLYHTNQIKASEIKFGNERRKQKRYFCRWEHNLSQVDFNKIMFAFNGERYIDFRDFFTQIDGMGNWATWKAADIMSKVFDVELVFDDMAFLKAYEYPLKGLLMINNEVEETRLYSNIKLYQRHIKKAYELSKEIKSSDLFNASDLLTLETCLCKYHSYKHGKYKVGEDLHRIKNINKNKQLNKYWGLI